MEKGSRNVHIGARAQDVNTCQVVNECFVAKSMYEICAGLVPGPQPGQPTGIYQDIQASQHNHRRL